MSDALGMRGVQMGDIVAPTAFNNLSPRVLLVAAIVHLTLPPRFYWVE